MILTVTILSFLVIFLVVDKIYHLTYTEPDVKLSAKELSDISNSVKDKAFNKKISKIIKTIDKKMTTAARRGHTSILVNTCICEYDFRLAEPIKNRIEEYLKDRGNFSFSYEKHIDVLRGYTTHICISW